MNFDFFALIPGSIGIVKYHYDISDTISDSYRQNYVDLLTGNALHTMIQKSIMNPAYVPNIEDEYIKMRNLANHNFNNDRNHAKLKTLEIQVGNKECLTSILQIQNDIKFKFWEDPQFIKAYIMETQMILKTRK